MTSIEWLESRIMGLIPEDIGSQLMFKSNIAKAKEMHKAEIEEAFKHGKLPLLFGQVQTAEQYYKETFGSKGSNAKDVVLGYKTSLDAQMLDSQLPQTTSDKWKEYQDWLNEPPEISDEEIQKAIDAYFPKTDINARWGWKLGAEWYREQIKNKL
jgi:hypothetical protein